jgi:hypothetical protein
MMTAPAPTLAALDFPAPVLACQWTEHHDGPTPPASYRAVKTCGCASLICDAHAELTRRAHNRAVEGIEPARCQTCAALPVLLAVLDPITKEAAR